MYLSSNLGSCFLYDVDSGFICFPCLFCFQCHEGYNSAVSELHKEMLKISPKLILLKALMKLSPYKIFEVFKQKLMFESKSGMKCPWDYFCHIMLLCVNVTTELTLEGMFTISIFLFKIASFYSLCPSGWSISSAYSLLQIIQCS